MTDPTDEEVRRVADALFEADTYADGFGGDHKTLARAAIAAIRAMDQEKAWITKMARLEGDAEIGAGVMARDPMGEPETSPTMRDEARIPHDDAGCTCLLLPEPPDDNCPLHGENTGPRTHVNRRAIDMD